MSERIGLSRALIGAVAAADMPPPHRKDIVPWNGASPMAGCASVGQASQQERVMVQTQVSRERRQAEHAGKPFLYHKGTSREATEQVVGRLRGT